MYEIPMEDLELVCEDADLDPGDRIRPGYSGRGMYGAQCLGLVGSPSTLVAFIVSATERFGADATRDMFSALSTDSMGTDHIYYWRNVTVTA